MSVTRLSIPNKRHYSGAMLATVKPMFQVAYKVSYFGLQQSDDHISLCLLLLIFRRMLKNHANLVRPLQAPAYDARMQRICSFPCAVFPTSAGALVASQLQPGEVTKIMPLRRR